MENKSVVIGLLSGDVFVKRDGTDLCHHPIEKQREICLFLNSLLKEKVVSDKHIHTLSFNESFKDVFLKCMEQYKKEHTTKVETPNYEHVEHPAHYNTYPMETIDMMLAIWGKEKVADWCEITAFKYRMRMGTKPNNSIEQDLKKEQWYLNKAKELRNEN
jgi:hypothetical protein